MEVVSRVLLMALHPRRQERAPRTSSEDSIQLGSLPLDIFLKVCLLCSDRVAILRVPLCSCRLQEVHSSFHDEARDADFIFGCFAEHQDFAGIDDDICSLQHGQKVWVLCVAGEHGRDDLQEVPMRHANRDARTNVLIFLEKSCEHVLIANENSELTIHKLCGSPPLFCEHGTARVGEALQLSDGFIGQASIIVDVWAVFSPWLASKEVKLTGFKTGYRCCD